VSQYGATKEAVESLIQYIAQLDSQGKLTTPRHEKKNPTRKTKLKKKTIKHAPEGQKLKIYRLIWYQ
jgi:hypothetical protein